MDEKENVENIEKRDEMIDTYIRRQAVIKNKFPKILEAPKSIQDEYFSLNTMIDSLQASRRKIWEPTIASDGCAIDSFVINKYEDAKSKYTQLKETNLEYITQEEENEFEFPEVDYDSIKTLVDDGNFYEANGKIMELLQEPLPEETKSKINDLHKYLAEAQLNQENTVDNKFEETEQVSVAKVDESKFAQIYGKAKGKIKEVFSKIKSLFNKEQNKENENENIDIDR